MIGQVERETSQAIMARRDPIAEVMIRQQYQRHPELAQSYGESGRRKCEQDARTHLEYLAQALAVAQPVLFSDYVGWARVMLGGRQIPVEDLVENLECMCVALQSTLPEPAAQMSVEYVRESLVPLASEREPLPSFLVEGQALSSLARDYLDALLAGKRQLASQLITEAVGRGVSVKDVYLQVFQPCQREIGRLWQVNQISVAQEHYCTAATQLIMSQLYPYLFAAERVGKTLVATCIAGDLHEIGVRMVSDIFELNGWDTFYLGANTPLPAIVQSVREQKADMLAISVTFIPNLALVQELIDLVRAAVSVKILVGGYPFNIAPTMWPEMGADGCAQDAAAAVELANRLVPSP